MEKLQEIRGRPIDCSCGKLNRGPYPHAPHIGLKIGFAGLLAYNIEILHPAGLSIILALIVP
jgi:hypothetical protein